MVSPEPPTSNQTGPNTRLFQGVKYFINDSIRPSIRSQLRQLLNENGATESPSYTKDQVEQRQSRFDLAHVTHIITDTLDLLEHRLIQSALNDNHPPQKATSQTTRPESDDLSVVSPLWVTRSYDLQRVQPTRFYSPDRTKIFSGMCFCTSDVRQVLDCILRARADMQWREQLPRADVAAIAAGVQALGGQWKAELTREVTHLFVLAPTGLKYEMAMLHGHAYGMVVLLPHWFEECLKLGQLTPIDLYQFPEPPLTHALRTDDSSKTFEERISDYWKKHALLQTGQPTPERPTATARLQQAESTTNQIFGAQRAAAGLASASYQTIVNVEARHHESSGTLQLPDKGHGRDVGRLGTSASVSSATLAPGSSSVVHAQHPDVTTPCPEPIFRNRRVYLASDLLLRPGLEKALKTRIEEAGGKCWSWVEDAGADGERSHGNEHANKVDRAHTDAFGRRRRAERELLKSDIVVTRTREGWEYWHAATTTTVVTSGEGRRLERMIGNMAWLYYVLANGKLDSPLDRLLHYPIPSLEGVPEFLNMTMTITNYVGAARDYVRTMIESLGATFEGTMTKQTSYVLTASEYGAKVKHARQWGIPLVSHLWLEACLAEWRFIDPASSVRFLSDSTCLTNFTSVLGNTPLRRDTIDRWSERPDVRALRAEAMKAVAPVDGGAVEQQAVGVGAGLGVHAGLEEGAQERDEQAMDVDGHAQDGRLPDRAVVRNDARDAKQDKATAVKVGKSTSPAKDKLGTSRKRALPTDQSEPEHELVAQDEEQDKQDDERDHGDDDDASEPVHRGQGRARPTTSKRMTVPTVAATAQAAAHDHDSPRPDPMAKGASRSPRVAAPAADAQSSALSSAETDDKKEDDAQVEEPLSEEEYDRLKSKKSKKRVISVQIPVRSSPSKVIVEEKSNSLSTPQGKPSRRRKRRDSTSSSSGDSSPPPPTSITRTFTLIDQENIIIGSSRRAAAGRATALLAQQMPDAIKFAQELKSSGHKKRRRLSSHQQSSQPQRTGNKRADESGDDDDDDDDDDEEEDDEADEPRAVVEKGVGRTGKKGPVKRAAPPVRATSSRNESDNDNDDDDDEADERAANGRGSDDDDEDDGDSSAIAPSKKRKKTKVAAVTPKSRVVATGAKKGSRLAQVTQGETTTQEGAVSSFDNPPKGKPPSKPSKKVMILSTGLGLDSKCAEIKTLKSLGANWTDSPAQVTHLVVKAMLRTEKFLSSLGAAPFIVTKDWVDASIKAGRLVEEGPYLLKDRAKEAELGETLEAIVGRAKQRKLFEGMTLFVTKGVKPDVQTMQRILQSGNAIVITSKISQPYQQAILRNRDTHLVVSCGADRHQWEALASRGVPIYTVEAVLHSVSVQSMAGFSAAANNRVDIQHDR